MSIEIETAEIEFREVEAAGNLRNFAETNDESEETEAVKESNGIDHVEDRILNNILMNRTVCTFFMVSGIQTQ